MRFTKLLSFLLLGLSLTIGTAQASIKSKEINKTFNADKDLSLKINGHYGKIQVKSWDQNSIDFQIKITVESSKPEKAQTMLDNITVEFTEGQNYVNAETIFGDFFSLQKLSNSIFSKGEMKIEYQVQVPKWLNMEIIQKNGNIYMDTHEGQLTIDLANGTLTAQELKGENQLTFRNATIKLKNLENAKMDIANSDFSLEDGVKITGESRDSKFKIKYINNLNLRSTRDKVDLEQVEFLYGASSMSKFEVSELGSELDYDLKLGHMNVFNVHHMFNFVKLDSKFADVRLNFMPKSYFNAEIKHKSVKMDYPVSFKLKQKDTADKNTYLTTGTVGEGKSASEVKIRANNCKIYLN